ncbi:MAG: DUF648 domain-containing protein [Chlamydia sp.]
MTIISIEKSISFGSEAKTFEHKLIHFSERYLNVTSEKAAVVKGSLKGHVATVEMQKHQISTVLKVVKIASYFLIIPLAYALTIRYFLKSKYTFTLMVRSQNMGNPSIGNTGKVASIYQYLGLNTNPWDSKSQPVTFQTEEEKNRFIKECLNYDLKEGHV